MEIRYYLPELDYFFATYWKENGQIPFVQINTPDINDPNSIPMNEKSIFALLFGLGFSNNYCDYALDRITNGENSRTISTRINCSRYTINSLLTTSDTTSGTFGWDLQYLLNIDNEVKILLSKLIELRLEGFTDISDINYSTLINTIARLIYIYIDYTVNGNYDLLNSDTPMSENGSILEVLYELYVVNEAYRKVKESGDLYLTPKSTTLRSVNTSTLFFRNKGRFRKVKVRS